MGHSGKLVRMGSSSKATPTQSSNSYASGSKSGPSSTHLDEIGKEQPMFRQQGSWNVPTLRVLEALSPVSNDPLLLRSVSLNEGEEDLMSDAVPDGEDEGEEDENEVDGEENENWDLNNEENQNEEHSEDDIQDQDQETEDKVEDICQRHPLWAQIVAENVERTRKNPEKMQTQPDIDFDMGELLEVVDDIIKTTVFLLQFAF
ncbi:hypothetical protein R1sor_013585 [Riccia sorocarpa]|uniref:Uncharacterized protein n=1 Tax=Riccia sorocarpa TaxID=122646 RepID=A0ABD3H8W0_9MARC